ncbi:organic cation transporter protein-like [Patiria miniata]|uniref:Major facilitator superfamily (MFS) profile domain-containing protein n=1 Tax=Patiria miniata TaxID=46514 RepID=A0A913ZP12_PATMI|nr:organic cation transporter protein-like [Patiria miniata]
MQYDDILRHIGAFGKYQKVLILLLAAYNIPTACQFLVQVFVAPDTDHWCVIPGSQPINCSQLFEAECQELQKNYGIPYELSPNGNKVYSSCERYVMDDEDTGSGLGPNATDVRPCDAGWDFDRSRYKSTIIEDYNLVCDRADYAGLAQSVWFVGLLVGSFVWGLAGDFLGRRKTFLICLLLVTVSSIGTAFIPNFPAFVVLRVITAACLYGSFLVTFIIASEMVESKKRVFVGTLFNLFFSFGLMLLSVMALLLREWRHLQLTISLQFVFFLPLLLLLPESPLLLMSKGKFDEAIAILTKIAKVNGTKVPENPFETSDDVKLSGLNQRSSVTPLDLVRTPNLRRITLIMWCDWFVVNMVYYGLSLSTSTLGIDDYLAAFVSAAVEIPSLFFSWYVMERFGRRLTMVALYVAGGVACLITIFLPLGAARAAVAMVGKFAITAVFNHVYIYACELFPTVIRSTGIGACSMVARVSGILCPFIVILGKHWVPLPLLVFGTCSVIAGILSLMLPETLGRNLPNTIAEGEQFGKSSSFSFCVNSACHSQGVNTTQPPADFELQSTNLSDGVPQPSGAYMPLSSREEPPTAAVDI